jgi:hypothetical protein
MTYNISYLYKYRLYTYFNRKQRLHVNPQGLNILVLIREKKTKIIDHFHYSFMLKNTHLHVSTSINSHSL